MSWKMYCECDRSESIWIILSHRFPFGMGGPLVPFTQLAKLAGTTVTEVLLE